MLRTTPFPGDGQWRIMAGVYPAQRRRLHVDRMRLAEIGSVMLFSMLRESRFINGS
ncbi:hypothetical protein [Acidovorax sp. CCYZU-2555]|uniref:hypothetical protein n=1 Tax=Acidovorax sp. CCYZU-2555 TaxID=2835042 RepID=UPI001BCFB148|nr:hypothetical protein [Acidovorax sp. CCYZU-2555]MBS7780761.1 hypothetical protein [Acidovorax sp. CCYZU-2555]